MKASLTPAGRSPMTRNAKGKTREHYLNMSLQCPHMIRSDHMLLVKNQGCYASTIFYIKCFKTSYWQSDAMRC